MKTRDKPVVASTQANWNLSRMNMTKWSIKEKLYLISCVLINGDSNWSKICAQLNRWMKFTKPYSANTPCETIRTNNQCSKQYKFLVNSYTKRHGISDLNELAEERLNELKGLVASNQETFGELYKEIEQILSMDASNFEELNEIYKSVKNQHLVSPGLPKGSKQTENEDDTLIQANLDQIEEIQKRQQEREAALAMERQRVAEAQKRLERAKAREAEAQRKMAEIAEYEKAEREKAERDALEAAAVAKMRPASSDFEVKTENVQSDTNNVEMDLFDKIRTSDMTKPIEMDTKKPTITDDKFSSDDEVPLNKLQKTKSDAEQTKTDSGIEWKPIVDNEENQTPKKISPDPESTTSTSATSDTHKKSSTSPDSTADSDLVKSKTQRSQNRRVIDSSTSCSQSSAGSSSDNEEEKSKKQTQKTAEELIFTPLISYEKKIAPVVAIEKSSPIKKVVEGSLPTEEDETTIEPRKQSPRKPLKPTEALGKESEPQVKTVNKPTRVTRTSESAVEKPESTNEEDKAETSDQQAGRMGSLRSSSKPTRGSPALQSKRRSIVPTKLINKNDEQLQLKSNNLLNAVSRIQSQNQSAESEVKPSKSGDSGLLSIIKSEPVQISATSTIGHNELEKPVISTPTDVNLSISTRSTRSHDAIPAPFSSSSTSSSISNNSFSSKFEDEKAYRAWKKSIMMVLNNITCHKHATIFMQPVRDEIAPGYSSVVFRPMDLTTIKKNIETGIIKSTKVFQRDVMLMFTNAIMYNSSNHDVHKISVEMYREVLNDVEQLLNAQENKYDDEVKPSRSKDKRSSTTSDRGVVMTGNDNESVESEAVSNISTKPSRKSSHNITKDETETGSMHSNSSFTAKTRGRGVEKKISSPSTLVASTSNSKKRRPSSSESGQAKKEEQQMPEPKSKKRRRSGR